MAAGQTHPAARPVPAHRLRPRAPRKRLVGRRRRTPRLLRHRNLAGPARLGLRPGRGTGRLDVARLVRMNLPPGVAPDRSEEHTSELQSLMRISYAVFCLKKKTKTTTRYKQ